MNEIGIFQRKKELFYIENENSSCHDFEVTVSNAIG